MYEKNDILEDIVLTRGSFNNLTELPFVRAEVFYLY
jgi:hypothetical protein